MSVVEQCRWVGSESCDNDEATDWVCDTSEVERCSDFSNRDDLDGATKAAEPFAPARTRAPSALLLPPPPPPPPPQRPARTHAHAHTPGRVCSSVGMTKGRRQSSRACAARHLFAQASASLSQVDPSNVSSDEAMHCSGPFFQPPCAHTMMNCLR
jgi:hypothetical protein